MVNAHISYGLSVSGDCGDDSLPSPCRTISVRKADTSCSSDLVGKKLISASSCAYSCGAALCSKLMSMAVYAGSDSPTPTTGSSSNRACSISRRHIGLANTQPPSPPRKMSKHAEFATAACRLSDEVGYTTFKPNFAVSWLPNDAARLPGAEGGC